MRNYEEIVKEANELAERLIKKKSRKTLGTYYILWVFYSFFEAIISSLPLSSLLSNIASALLVVPFIYLSLRLSYNFNVEYLRLKRGEKFNKKKFDKYFALSIIPFAIPLAILIYSLFTGIFILYILFGYVYVSVIEYYLIITFRWLGNLRYYDVFAMIGLLLLPLSYFSDVFPTIMVITWTYAGTKSLLEVIEV
ncbi:MAG: hypothetical protein JZD40_03765 [Sulfolobus sp.]|nr:hypothetical protein [Sulfolobus sp.]